MHRARVGALVATMLMTSCSLIGTSYSSTPGPTRADVSLDGSDPEIDAAPPDGTGTTGEGGASKTDGSSSMPYPAAVLQAGPLVYLRLDPSAFAEA
jgi:hypothetical protein